MIAERRHAGDKGRIDGTNGLTPNTPVRKTLASEPFLALAMMLNSLAVTLMIKADFGISAVSSVPYALYVAFPALSLGTWNAIIQCTWLIVTMIAIRKVKPGYIVSFGLAFLFGLMMDVWEGIIAPWPGTMVLRIGYFAVGFIMMAIGISLFFQCGTPVLPFDTVPRAFIVEKGVSVRAARTGFDLLNLSLALVIGLAFLGRPVGIGIGTLLGAVLMGIAVAAINQWISSRYHLRPKWKVLEDLA